MAQVNHLDPMEDNRFLEVKKLKKSDLHHHLHWFLKEDVFTNELCGVYQSEINELKEVGRKAIELFHQTTDELIKNNDLKKFGFPQEMNDLIQYTWQHKDIHPFLLGRFDINGGFGATKPKIIEFNADTCTTIPETILWQKNQIDLLPGKLQFNNLFEDLVAQFKLLKSKLDIANPFLLASSLGYIEDAINCQMVLSAAHKAGFQVNYADLPEVVFSDDGVFIEFGSEYQPVDVLFKMFPWDWICHEEPDLLEDLSKLILSKKLTVLNPPYSAIWQNKAFFLDVLKSPEGKKVLADTQIGSNGFSAFVEKPIYGRLGENIQLFDGHKKYQTKGDYSNQEKVFQEYIPLPKDTDGYYYQVGLFYTNKASSINFRAENRPIITENAEFISHYII